MIGVAEAISSWREFYGAVSNAAAALLGLVFVGLSLQRTLGRANAPVRSLAIGSAITLIQPMLVALVMLVPDAVPTVNGIGLIVLALVLGAQLVVVMRIRLRDHGDSRPWLFYRYVIPLTAAAVLFAGGAGMLSGSAGAVFAPAIAVFALFVVGVQDAWDLLSGDRGLRATSPSTKERS